MLPPSSLWLLWPTRTATRRVVPNCSSVATLSTRKYLPMPVGRVAINCVISLADSESLSLISLMVSVDVKLSTMFTEFADSDRTVILKQTNKKTSPEWYEQAMSSKPASVIGVNLVRLSGWRPVSLTVDLSHPSNTSGLKKKCTTVFGQVMYPLSHNHRCL